jgi:uncharacterized membrane protein YvbJ
MYCPNCGKQNEEGASFCIHCGKPLSGPEERAAPESPEPPPLPPAPVHIPNYLVWAIVATVLCCLPFGIPAIIYAAQANSRAALGDLAGAKSASNTALVWCSVATAAGVLYWIAYFVFIFSVSAWAPDF